MVSSCFIALAAAGLAMAAVSADPTAYTLLNLPDDRPAISLKTPPVGRLRVGDLRLTLEKTPLSQIAAKFGGATRSGGEAGAGATWLCYRDVHPGRTLRVIWFISHNEMGGGVRLTQVAEQVNLPAIPDFCAKPRAIVALDAGVPAIGSSRSAVEKQFGSTVGPAVDYLGFENTRPYRALKVFTTTQTLQYHFNHGLADTVSIAQVTSR